MGWYNSNIVDAGKEPLAWCLAAFVVTFLVTRIITRLIRRGVGPFRNQVRADGVHIHHAVPGLILLLIGAVTAVAAINYSTLLLAALCVGVGASLVLDEFALILHLQDVYWAKQGRASVQAVAFTVIVLSLALLGITPASSTEFTDPDNVVQSAIVVSLVFTLPCAVVCAMKGKYRLLLLAPLLPFVVWIAAFRVARPGSPWFRRYAEDSPKRQRAGRRSRLYDEHIAAPLAKLADLIAGAPDD